MSDLEKPKDSLPKQIDQAALESNPKFQEGFLQALKITLIKKKFGVSFYEKYQQMEFRRGLEDSEGKIKKRPGDEEMGMAHMEAIRNPLLPEVRAFELEAESMNTPDEIKKFAIDQGLEFTIEEIEEAKKTSRELMEYE